MKSLNPALLLALGCANAAGAITEHTAIQQTLHFSGPGPHTLEVRTLSGRITVQSHAGSDVQMLVDRTITAHTPAGITAAEHAVVLDTSTNGLLARAIVRQPHQRVCGDQSGAWPGSWWAQPRYQVRFDFTILVPPDTRLALCTINDGDVTVTGVRGDFSIRSVNGRITMTGVGGSGEAITVNGPVTASFISPPRAASLFKTINGGVVITLPASAQADLRMKAVNGGLYTDFKTQTLPPEALHVVQKTNGMHVYQSNGFTTVRIGRGGPELTLDTFNGDVRVLRRSR